MESQARSHTLIRLQIDELKPKRVTLIATVLIFLLGLFFILSVVVPYPLRTIQPDKTGFCIQNLLGYTNAYDNCSATFDYTTNPIYMNRIFNVSGLNQLFYSSVVLKQNANGTAALSDYTLNFQVKLSIYILENETYISDSIIKEEEHDVDIHCGKNDENTCDETTVLLLPELKENNYFIIIEVLNTTTYSSSIENGTFYTFTIASQYSNYLLGLRYTFVCVSMITCFIYIWRMRNLRMRDWIMEQKAIMVLSFLLILFNNPFYALVIVLPGEASFFFSTLFTVNFCIYLYGFWLTTYQRIRLENQQKYSKTLTIGKGVFIFLLWLFVLTSLLVLNHCYLNDPGFDFDSEYQKTFLAFKIIAILFSVVALLWLLREIVYIIQTFKSRIWRQKLLFVLSSFFIFAFFVFIFSGAFSSFNDNGSRVLLSITIMNLYVFVLQLLYTPTAAGIRETQQIERAESERPSMQYDVLEDNINIEFNSPYNDQGIHMQNEGEDFPNPEHEHHYEEDHHKIQHDDEESEDHTDK